MTGGITNSTSINPLTTLTESWIGPSSTNGIYFKGSNVGIGTTAPGSLLHVAGDLRIGGGTQDYVFSKRATILTLQSQTAGVTSQVEYYTKSGDGTADNGFAVFAKGIPSDLSNFEQFRFYYDHTTPAYVIGTNKGGTGSYRDIRIGNGLIPTDLVIQATTGNVGIGTTAPIISNGIGLHLAGKILRIESSKTPVSSGDTGNTGEICWDDNYIYVCISTNTWKRSPLSTW
jgi:hypothetical protein